MRFSSISAVSLCALGALSVVSQSAQAQSCAQGSEHWSFDSRYYYELYAFWCTPRQHDPADARKCSSDMASNFSNTPPSAAGSTQAIVGLASYCYTDQRNGQPVYNQRTRCASTPAACVFPAGGSATADGKVHLIHSPRYNAASPTQWDAAFERLRGNTSMCLGDGNDTITVAQLWMLCGGIAMVPFNYYGYGFYAYGEGGSDRITGGIGSDWLYGGTGDDVLTGRTGTDALSGDANADILYGDSGDDLIMGGSGRDYMIDSGGSLDVHMGHSDSDCFWDLSSQAIYGYDGVDIAGSDTRAGAQLISSVEATSGWCIPE